MTSCLLLPVLANLEPSSYLSLSEGSAPEDGQRGRLTWSIEILRQGEAQSQNDGLCPDHLPGCRYLLLRGMETPTQAHTHTDTQSDRQTDAQTYTRTHKHT